MAETFAEVVARVEAECRRRSIRMIGPHKAAKLVEWLRQAEPKRVVEVGTAIGYSGLIIANTLREMGGGQLITIELDPKIAAEAGENFRAAGVEGLITQLIGDARELVKSIDGPVDLLFLDGGFANYYPCFEGIRPRLRDGTWLIADNAWIGEAEMGEYLMVVRGHYPSHTEWFDTDLAWNPRDAMEVSVYREGVY